MLTGDLREFSTTDVLGLLGRSAVDGALVVDGDASATVHCRAGDVTFATTRLGTSLADVLVAAGFLDAAEWAEAAAAGDAPAALARVLAERGADPIRLTQVLQARTEEAVFEIGLWRYGTFRFEPGADHLLGDAFRFPIPDLLGAVAGREARWGAIVAHFGSLDHVVAPVAVADAGSDDDELVLNRTQFRVLTAAARHRSVRGLAEDLGLGLFATGELVAGLIERRLLSAAAPDLAPPPPVAVEDLADPIPEPARAAAIGPFAASLQPVGAGVGAAGGFDGGFERSFDAGLTGFDGGAAVDGFGGQPLPHRNGGGTNGHGADGHGAEPADGPAGAAAPSGVEFVAPGDAPARDLILRLLTAVKEL